VLKLDRTLLLDLDTLPYEGVLRTSVQSKARGKRAAHEDLACAGPFEPCYLGDELAADGLHRPPNLEPRCTCVSIEYMPSGAVFVLRLMMLPVTYFRHSATRSDTNNQQQRLQTIFDASDITSGERLASTTSNVR
jgi:hypothetical protein